jgi:dipeptidyl aminopeptidase/acylaminoacyl peptidase
VSRVKLLEEYGYPFPRGIGLEKWKQSSIALNAANIVTPLLIQSSDSEAMFSVEAYKALKYYGAPVDWYVYPEEGHLKHQPLNKYYVYRRNLDWMRFWLKDEVTDGPDRRDQYSKWQAMKEAFRARQLSTEKKIDH